MRSPSPRADAIDVVDPPVAPNPTTIAGSYQLTTVNGQKPAVPRVRNRCLVAGVVNLNANGAYALEFNIRIDDSGNIRTSTNSDAGRWNVTRDGIALASTAGHVAQTGTVAGNAITLTTGTDTLVLRK